MMGPRIKNESHGQIDRSSKRDRTGNDEAFGPLVAGRYCPGRRGRDSGQTGQKGRRSSEGSED